MLNMAARVAQGLIFAVVEASTVSGFNLLRYCCQFLRTDSEAGVAV